MAKGGTSATGRRKSNTRLFLALAIILLILFGGVTYIIFYNPPTPRLVIDWRFRIFFYDLQTGANLTLPPGIGVQNEVISNYTLVSYGPDGYAPLSTRDSTGTVYIQSRTVAIYTFEDLFNIWGKQFNQQCVPNPATNFANLYCTRPGESIIWDADNDSGTYDAADQLMVQGDKTPPAFGSPLSRDSHITYIDSDSNGKWDQGESIIYDSNSDGLYDSHDRIIFTGTTTPTLGASVKTDPRILFIDSVILNGTWDPPILPPAMIDIGLDRERCVNQSLGLSANKIWEIIINSPIGVLQNC